LRYALIVFACVAGCTSSPAAVRPDSGTLVVGPMDCAPEDLELQATLDDGRCVTDDRDDDDDGTVDTADCAPRDQDRAVALERGDCVADDADDDDDGTPDEADCAPRDPTLDVTLDDGACVGDDADDDGDGVLDVDDCAPTDRARGARLVDGSCVRDDTDDDDDGTSDARDCEPRDPSLEIVLEDSRCVRDDDDDDDDGVTDGEDCASTDGTVAVPLADETCVADDGDDDDDGVDDTDDCASRDASREILLTSGSCVPDDDDDDDDGAADSVDCAARDPARRVVLDDATCVADDADDDDDGVADASDCAPLDATREVTLAGGGCAADDGDDDDDGVADPDDCAPRDSARWLALDVTTCVADDDDDDDDGAADALDCSPRDARYVTGVCDLGEVDAATCGVETGACASGTRSRTCLATCFYGAWGECGGAHVPPAPESCVEASDEDCDGAVDEGCGCDPVAPGAAGGFVVADTITDLQVDPVRCLLYGMDIRATPERSQLVVFDTRAKSELARIELGPGFQDFDVARDGSRLAVGNTERRELWILRPPSWAPTAYPVYGAITDVAVTASGIAIYLLDTGRAYRIDLATGSISDSSTLISSFEDFVLGPDDLTLFTGDVAVRNGNARRYDVARNGSLTLSQSGPHGLLDLPKPYLAVSADGRYLAWAGAILDARDLTVVYGRGYDWHLDAFDARGQLLVAGGGIVDVQRARPVADPWSTTSVTLLPGDQEVWWYDYVAGQMRYANVGDFVDYATLGRREWPPRPLADYDFTDLLVDPVRPWLYAIDGGLGEVVVLDRATLTPITSIEAGIVATDAEMDPGGRYLYIGHALTWGVARIDLDDLTYAGLVPTGIQPFEIASPRPGRIVSVGDRQTGITLSDTFGMSVLGQLGRAGFYEAALSVAPDGFGIYVGDSGTSGSTITVLDTRDDVITEVRESPYSEWVEHWDRAIASIPGTTDVYWARARYSTETLTSSVTVTEPILTVTPDGRLAISRSRIFDAATGASVAALPISTAAQAVSADGRTLYLGSGSSVRAVDLSRYAPTR
jgi:hypothetical protein